MRLAWYIWDLWSNNIGRSLLPPIVSWSYITKDPYVFYLPGTNFLKKKWNGIEPLRQRNAWVPCGYNFLNSNNLLVDATRNCYALRLTIKLSWKSSTIEANSGLLGSSNNLAVLLFGTIGSHKIPEMVLWSQNLIQLEIGRP